MQLTYVPRAHLVNYSNKVAMLQQEVFCQAKQAHYILKRNELMSLQIEWRFTVLYVIYIMTSDRDSQISKPFH